MCKRIYWVVTMKNFKKFWAEKDLGRHTNIYILDYTLGDIKRDCSNWKMNKCEEN